MEEYDYIIVGAGSAGCVLAGRLSEDPDARVLLVEAGGPDSNPLIHIPIGLGRMHGFGLYDWGYETEPEPNLGGRRLDAMRGKVLGGSSSINVLAFTRGHRGDYDRWASNGATGWSFAECLPYFKRCETWVGGESVWRGGSGPIGVEWARTEDTLFAAWVAAGREAGYPVTDDYNGAEAEGFGRSQYTIRAGRRSSASVAYLRPALGRANLAVRTRVHVARVLVEGTRATGIELLGRRGLERVRAEREVILAAGAFNTPQILMLSGIGPADELTRLGIRAVADLPVGRNLQDHLAVLLMWERPEPGPFHREMRLDRMVASMLRAHWFGTGPATVVPGGLHAFVRTRAGLDVPDLEFMFRGLPGDARLWFPGWRRPYRDGFGIRPALLHPRSRGRVTLHSPDPRSAPRIACGFLSDPDDLALLREGFRRARDLAYRKPLDPFRGVERAPGRAVQSDAEVDAWIRRAAATAHHPAGTCAMGSGAESVLDPELRVRGIERLRVVDASAMPDLVSGHINAAVVMMAEKAADMIRGRPPLAADDLA